jgi:hypothetical protein
MSDMPEFEVFCVLRPDGCDEPLTLKDVLNDARAPVFEVCADAVDNLIAHPGPLWFLANGIPVFLAFQRSEDCHEYRRRIGRLHNAGRA